MFMNMFKECIVGFNFASEEEATIFEDTVIGLQRRRREKRMGNITNIFFNIRSLKFHGYEVFYLNSYLLMHQLHKYYYSNKIQIIRFNL